MSKADIAEGARNATHSYIARRKDGCGCLCWALVDNPADRRYVAREVAAIIRDGYEVERLSTEQIRAERWECARCRPQERLALEDAA